MEEAYINETLMIVYLLGISIAEEIRHSITLYFVDFGKILENMKKHEKHAVIA